MANFDFIKLAISLFTSPNVYLVQVAEKAVRSVLEIGVSYIS